MLIITILFVFQIQAQRTLFDTLQVDSSTKIIGRHPHYDKHMTYSKYNFILENAKDIEKFIRTIKLADEVSNSIEDPAFKLSVIKNKQEIGTWTINPNLGSAMTHDGHTYKFDLAQISNLNRTNPFDYSFKVEIFKSKDQYVKFLNEQKGNPNFLFHYGPQFTYEGSFEIEFIKSDAFPHPKAISEYLEKHIEKILGKDEYSVSYKMSKKNMSERNQYTMTIEGPEKLYKKLKLSNLKNENWIPMTEDGYFFYKK